MNEAAHGLISRYGLREMISRKAYERKEIADTQISENSPIPVGTFKDPYIFDSMGIKDEYLEADLEEAIIRELEKFILEFGKGFAFIERQKRMIIDGIAEARAYLDEPVLRERLLEISQALFEIEETNPIKVLGHTDAMKVKSSITLFLAADPTVEVFRNVLDKFYQGKPDTLTADMLEK